MPNSWDFNKLNQAYTTYLGRNAGQGEYNDWANGVFTGDPENWDYIENQIRTSGEAQEYNTRKGQQTSQPQASEPILPGGSATVPPTAQPTEPQRISPPTFEQGTKEPVPPPAAPGTPPPAAPAATGSPTFNVGADANNKFDDYTYAGFDPQKHQGANLSDPMNAKYALQQYMVENHMPLTGGQNGNARAIASALNARYGAAYGNPNFFTAIDSETIMMPDGQYIHAAPGAGYGMPSGTYDPKAKGTVFWSSTDRPFTGQADPWQGTPTPGSPSATTAAPPPTNKAAGGGVDLAKMLSLLNGGGGNTGPALPSGYGGPSAPIQPGNNQVGDDPLSKLITSGLAGLILNGGTPYGRDVMTTLNDIIGGRTPNGTRNSGQSGPTRTPVPVVNPGGNALSSGVQRRLSMADTSGLFTGPRGNETGRQTIDGSDGTGTLPDGSIPLGDPSQPPPVIGGLPPLPNTDIPLGNPNDPPLPPPMGAPVPVPTDGNGGAPPDDADPDAGDGGIFTAGDPNDTTPLWQEAGLTPGIANRLIMARDAEAGSFQSMLSDARNLLASRGLAGAPGVAQGPEAGAIGRISEQLAPSYAAAVGDIEKEAMTEENANVMHALTLATGMAQSQAANMLAAIGQGTQRQTALAQIALDTLNTNIQWQEFLASYGLQRDQVAAQIQSGNIANLVPLLQMFLTLASQSAQGYIGVN